MLQSISQLSALTGIHRGTVSKLLKDLPAHPGKKNAIVYESMEALPVLYQSTPGKTKGPADLDLSRERARLAHHQANVTAMQEAELKGQLVLADTGPGDRKRLVALGTSAL